MERKVELFKERQNFMTAWTLGLMLVILFVLLTDVYQHYVETGVLTIDFVVWLVLLVLVYLLLSRLYTTIDNAGIEITFLPFAWRRRWNWSSMTNVCVRKYDLMEFGGWGFRLGRNGTAYTCRGWYGIQIELKSGRRILIGTQSPEQVSQIITKIQEDGTK